MGGVFLIRNGIFTEGRRVEGWPGLPQVASASDAVHQSPEATCTLKSCFPLNVPLLVKCYMQKEGCSESSATCTFSLRLLQGFHGQSFLLTCYKISASDANSPPVLASLSATQEVALHSA